jgi:hypothetical protein|nr:hypothetical protein Q903MT_gene957 [Picea sitchensis]
MDRTSYAFCLNVLVPYIRWKDQRGNAFALNDAFALYFIRELREIFDYLLNKGVPSPVPSPNEGLDSSGVNGTPIHNKGLGRSTLPCHSRRRIC